MFQVATRGNACEETDRLKARTVMLGGVLGLVTRAEGHLDDRSIDWSQGWDRVVADFRTFRERSLLPPLESICVRFQGEQRTHPH